MKSYVVGGAVRDRLLGLPVVDRDHVVVGATVDEMLAAGFRPVGRDFPVFLHPRTHEEYALARTERKVSRGYAGFVFHADPSVTLEADLERRDLTINAMAEDEGDGLLIDPFGGQADLAARVFRHVGPAFVEDPVRALRVARFAARFVDFDLAPETDALLRAMTEHGEIDALVPERVWQEIARGLMEARPSRMFAVLMRAGALQRIAPEIASALGEGHGLDRAIDRSAVAAADLDVRFALIGEALGADRAAAVASLAARLATPRSCRDLALLAATESAALRSATVGGDAAALVAAMERCDAFRRAERFDRLRQTIALSTDGDAEALFGDERLRLAAAAAAAVDASAIARLAGYQPERIATDLRAARVAATQGAFAAG